MKNTSIINYTVLAMIHSMHGGDKEKHAAVLLENQYRRGNLEGIGIYMRIILNG
jgi:hypothetical protein